MENVTVKSPDSKETYLYRIMPLSHFLQMLDSQKMYLPRVSQWEDPYELFLFKQHFVNSTGQEIDVLSQASRIYGQCWSSVRKSDALWRIYSQDHLGVQIKTSVEKLNLLIEQQIGKGLFLRLEQVKYMSEKDLSDWIASLKTPMNSVQDSLFIKRDSFSHEKEYRLIAWLADVDENNKPVACCPDHIDLSIDDPLQIIYEVNLDPRLTKEEAELLKNAIALRLGGKCRISQSTLYKFKQHTIII